MKLARAAIQKEMTFSSTTTIVVMSGENAECQVKKSMKCLEDDGYIRFESVFALQFDWRDSWSFIEDSFEEKTATNRRLHLNL